MGVTVVEQGLGGYEPGSSARPLAIQGTCLEQGCKSSPVIVFASETMDIKLEGAMPGVEGMVDDHLQKVHRGKGEAVITILK